MEGAMEAVARESYAACVSAIMREGLGALDLFDDASIADTASALERIMDFAESHGAELEAMAGSAMVETVRIPAAEFARSLGLLNQYVNLGAEAKARIADSYAAFFRDFLDCLGASGPSAEERLGDCIVLHRRRLGSVLAGVEGLREAGRTVSKPCFCYSPELQMRILRLDEGRIAEPLLDLGCGPDALLVRALRARGVEAFGVDRSIREPEPFLSEAGWEEFSLGSEAWGTVVSNLAFSNHFIYRYIRNDGSDLAYARLYMDILSSLRVGGGFHYAPSLPFIERHLGRERYVVDEYPLMEGLGATVVRRLSS